MAIKSDNACYKCADRKVTDDYNCHSHCEKYAKFKAEREDQKARERELDETFITSRRRKSKYYRARKEDGYNV